MSSIGDLTRSELESMVAMPERGTDKQLRGLYLTLWFLAIINRTSEGGVWYGWMIKHFQMGHRRAWYSSERSDYLG